MAKTIPIPEHFQHFLAEMKEGFWGDVCGQTKAGLEAAFGGGSMATATTCGISSPALGPSGCAWHPGKRLSPSRDRAL
jgi:hypothetical protein